MKAAGRGLRAHSRARPDQRLSRPSPVLPVTEQRLVLRSRTHGTHTLTAVAAAVAHFVIVRTEAEAPRVVRVARVERTRPVEAVAACVEETAIAAVASGGQEETVAVRSGEESSVHAVLRRPSDGRVVVEFLPFFKGGHAPVWSPVGRGRIVLGQEGGQVIGEALVAVAGVVAVLGQRVFATIAVLVGAPVIGVLRLGLVPGEVVAVVLGSFGTYVTGGPEQAARKAEVDVVVLMKGRAAEADRGRLRHMHEEALHRGHGATVDCLHVAVRVIHHDGHRHQLAVAGLAVDVDIIGEGVAQQLPTVVGVSRALGVLDDMVPHRFSSGSIRVACQRKLVGLGAGKEVSVFYLDVERLAS